MTHVVVITFFWVHDEISNSPHSQARQYCDGRCMLMGFTLVPSKSLPSFPILTPPRSFSSTVLCKTGQFIQVISFAIRLTQQLTLFETKNEFNDLIYVRIDYALHLSLLSSSAHNFTTCGKHHSLRLHRVSFL